MFFRVLLCRFVNFRLRVKVRISVVMIFIKGGMVIEKQGRIFCVLFILLRGVFGVMSEGKMVVLVKQDRNLEKRVVLYVMSVVISSICLVFLLILVMVMVISLRMIRGMEKLRNFLKMELKVMNSCIKGVGRKFLIVILSIIVMMICGKSFMCIFFIMRFQQFVIKVIFFFEII